MAAPAVTWSVFLEIAVRVLKPLLRLVSEELRELLSVFVVKFYWKAQKTDNPWDDFLAEVLLKILGIPVPTEEK
jgi:hypothetical protein